MNEKPKLGSKLAWTPSTKCRVACIYLEERLRDFKPNACAKQVQEHIARQKETNIQTEKNINIKKRQMLEL